MVNKFGKEELPVSIKIPIKKWTMLKSFWSFAFWKIVQFYIPVLYKFYLSRNQGATPLQFVKQTFFDGRVFQTI